MSEQEFWMHLCASYAALGDSPALAAAKADDAVDELQARYGESRVLDRGVPD